MIDSERIKKRLRQCGYTQEQAAREIGINPSTLNRKINNTNGETLTVKEVGALKEILDIEKKELATFFFVEELAKTQDDLTNKEKEEMVDDIPKYSDE